MAGLRVPQYFHYSGKEVHRTFSLHLSQESSKDRSLIHLQYEIMASWICFIPAQHAQG